MISIIKRLPFFNLFKVLVGLALLVISLWGVNWSLLLASLEKVTLIWFLGVICTLLASLFLKIWRSFILLKNFGVEITFSRTAEAFFLGQAINFLLPSRGGDFLRLGYLGVDRGSQIPQITAALVFEKFLDLIAMTVVALGVSTYLPVESAFWVRSWLLPLSILMTAGLLFLLLFGPQTWLILKSWLSRWSKPWLQKIIVWGDRLVQSSQWLRSPRGSMIPLWITILIWVVMWGTNHVLFQGFSLRVPLIASGLVLVLGYIGVLPNLMPGNVGPFYFFVQLGMTPFGISQEKGLAYTVLLHAVVTLIPLIASGISLLVSESVRESFSTIRKSL